MLWEVTQDWSGIRGKMRSVGDVGPVNGSIAGTINGSTLTFRMSLRPERYPDCTIAIDGTAMFNLSRYEPPSTAREMYCSWRLA